MKRAAGILLLSLACTSTQPFAVDDATKGAIASITQAVEQNPTHQPLIYILATYHDKARDSAAVVFTGEPRFAMPDQGWFAFFRVATQMS